MIEWLVNKKVFRNANHAIWFICTIGFILILLGCLVKINLRFLIATVALVVHLPPLMTSVVTVYKKRVSEVYSQDCIWFNIIMLIAYLFIWLKLI
jgi:hypothetical protein